ncbi:class II peroxidase [Aulographum hederae CBS 113979]|uniref:Class II peroxidase n=1 Tax=Aulographum hederae CBS 113979 TaxID=1176131 RepID=A0A6G1H5X7_9PEZI|nr:class II peroxidase [Aulographum hederae CBS 113979]
MRLLSIPGALWTFSLLQYGATAVPTWPAASDELEELMFLTSGYRSRGFPTAITPCSKGAGTGRVAAAEWLRTAFHDVAPGSIFTGIGGLDASLIYELSSAENIGPAFNTTLQTYSSFFSSKSSMADIIALGVYTSVRGCGGPVVPIKPGRIDASESGPSGVPLPQNSFGTFQNQFARIGFNTSEMIAVTACGHTIGGTHASNFPEIVPLNTAPNDVIDFDTTNVTFDNKVITEYFDGTTKNPMIRGPSASNGRNSDFRVFNGDRNTTMTSMQTPAAFASTCGTVLQKMIEVVPSGVTLGDVLVPYQVKPTALSLYLLTASNMSFSGEIRVRTTTLAASQIASVQLVYKDTTGGSSCGSSCMISTAYKGTGSGFDDTFTYYGFSTAIPTSSSISSFNVVVTLVGGTSTTYDNNGAGFAIDDSILIQKSQSCSNAGTVTITAAVRSSVSRTSANLALALKTLRSGLPAPGLSSTSVSMTPGATMGSWTIFSGSYSLTAGQNATTNVPLPARNIPSSEPSTVASATAEIPSPRVRSQEKQIAIYKNTGFVQTINPNITGFNYLGCYTDRQDNRTLGGTSTSNSSLTVEFCATFCTGKQFFGVEYGSECYCGPSLNTAAATLRPGSECSMSCGGNSTEYCGSGNRMNVYNRTTILSDEESGPSLADYTYQGCYSDSTASRSLSSKATQSNSLTYASCASFCAGYSFFGVEYGSECYCGNSLSTASSKVVESDCSFACSGDASKICGAGSRMNVFKTSSSTGSSTGPANPVISGYNYTGCYTDSVGTRTLNGSYLFDNALTIQKCATFCNGAAFFGAEYGGECYCGAQIGGNGAKVVDSDCGFLCSGNSTQYCGAGDRLTVYGKLG